MTKANIKFTDSHCHLDFKEFTQDLPLLIQQCANNKVHQIVVPAITPENWQSVLTIAQQYSIEACKIFPCLGIHPWFLRDLTSQHLQQLANIVSRNFNDLVAIGETGIDGVIAKEQGNLHQQIEFFEFQLALAKQYALPVIVHHRRSHQDIMVRLKRMSLEHSGIIHAFSGSYQQACQYIDLGFKLGIGGTITYPRAEKTIKAIKRLPLSSLVIETDAPAMPLYGYQGKVNSPLMLCEVFQCLTTLRTESKEMLAQALEENIRTILPALTHYDLKR
jgi:TatD DNase family protein